MSAAIDHIGHWLPSQGPLKDFIHHNTLHAVQHMPFHEGVAVAAKVFGAKSYLPLADYQQRYRQGRIRPEAIEWAIDQLSLSSDECQALRDSLFVEDHHGHLPPLSLANDGIRNAWTNYLEVDLNASVHPVMFRLLSNFLDQGISRWALPKDGETFWDCVRRLTLNSLIPLYPFHEISVRGLLDGGEEQAIMFCLEKIVGDQSLYTQYLLEVLLGHPGWSGMVRVIETNPQALLVPRDISLKQMLAVELICELAFVHKKKGDRFLKIAQLPELTNVPLFNERHLKPEIPLKLRVWHEAMEWSLHGELLVAMRDQPLEQTPATAPTVQAVFCIDDRECSLRRYLEEVHPSIETFGAPGFFGIDFLYQGLEDGYPVAQCPAVIKPRHLVMESVKGRRPEPKDPRQDISKMHFSAHSLGRGWIYTQTLGLAYAVRLALDVFRPVTKLPRIRRLSELEVHSHLHLMRETDAPNEDGYLLGFSLAEMADKVGGQLGNIGLTTHFAPLVVAVAHGSSSVNNPHFAAYDCGACAGKPGAPNARAFAWMANHPEVRRLLRQRGIDIPDSTHFVAAMHNTSRDEVSYFDQQTLDKTAHKALQEFQHSMNTALRRNARERCRWFELGPNAPDNATSHRHVKERASSIFEPRPEYNHSNNLYAVVGRRALTRHLFMDRRAFLQSYDPTTDNDGEILAKILSAVIPVCGGINLEYLFSRIDNSVYGAGTKLPHNVIGLLGVANGVEGDLRTGLPSQMIEVHEPARLLLVVEQRCDIIDLAIAKLGELKEWLENEWVILVACQPPSRDMKLYRSGIWQGVDFPKDVKAPVADRSEKIIVGQTKTIPVHQFTGRVA
ncbi:YbcC family protein [Methylomonas sp. MgM2]